MSITKTLEADLKRMQTEQQPTLMVQALRRRRDELTFADVLSILASPLGHGLASVQIRELFVGEAGDSPAQSPKLSTTPATSPRRTALGAM